MPIPSPGNEESHDEFIERCMSNDTMSSEFTDNDQRLAVCEQNWKDNKDGSSSMNESKLRFTDSKRFKQIHKSGDSPSNVALRKQYVSKSIEQEGGEDSRVFRFTVSTNAVDRDGDTVSPEGFDLKNYRSNPVVLFAHQSDRPPIGRAPTIGVENGSLKASVEFMNNDIDTSGFSDMMYRMVKHGFMKATSVGFLPIEYKMADGADEKRAGGIDFSKQELLEFSIVPVPSNPEALIEARSKGINTEPLQGWFEEALDDWMSYRDLLLIPKKTVEAFYKAAGNRSNHSLQITSSAQDDLRLKNLQSIFEYKASKGEEVSDLGQKLLDALEIAGKNSEHIRAIINKSKEQEIEMAKGIETQDIELENPKLGFIDKASELEYSDDYEEKDDKSNNSTPHMEDDEDPNATPPDRDESSNSNKGDAVSYDPMSDSGGDEEDDDGEDDSDMEEEGKSNNESPHMEDDPLQPNGDPNEEDDHNANKDSSESEEKGDMEDDEEEEEKDLIIVIENEEQLPKAASEIVAKRPKEVEKKSFSSHLVPRLSARLFNTPLVIEQRKLNTLMCVLSDKLGTKGFLEEAPTNEELAKEGSRTPYHIDSNGVATISIMGTLVQRSVGLNAFSGLKSYKEIEEDFLKAIEDSNVKAIALHIDSPGGEVSGCFDLADTIYEARGSKPIWAIVDEMACSAAYAIASAADEILAPRTASVGSIGVVWLHADYSRAERNAGIDYTFIHAGERKVDGNSYEPLSAEAAKRIQREIDDTYEIFLETVARNRGIEIEKLKNTQAATFNGREAEKIGLIDKISSSRNSFHKLINVTKEAITKQNSAEDFTVQRLCLPKSHWESAEMAQNWVQNNGFSVENMDESESEFRFNQLDLRDFSDIRAVCYDPIDVSASDMDCKVLAYGGKVLEKDPNAVTLALAEEFSKSMREYTKELKKFNESVKENLGIKDFSGVKDKQVENKAQEDDAEKMVAEMLPEILPQVIKDVLRMELKKIKGQVD